MDYTGFQVLGKTKIVMGKDEFRKEGVVCRRVLDSAQCGALKVNIGKRNSAKFSPFSKMESGISPICFIQADPNEATLGFAREYLDF